MSYSVWAYQIYQYVCCCCCCYVYWDIKIIYTSTIVTFCLRKLRLVLKVGSPCSSLHISDWVLHWSLLRSWVLHWCACCLRWKCTTPFSCLCWVLLKMKLSQSLLWFANQWILVHLFHTRQNVLCVVMLVVARDWENVWQNMNVLLTVLLVGGAVIMLGGLNPYWTQKKTEQLFTREDWNFHSVIPQINNNNNKSTNQCNGSLTASPKKAKRDSKKIN